MIKSSSILRINSYTYLLIIIGCIEFYPCLAQISFNDLLIINELEHAEFVNVFLLENQFEYQGRVDKDEDGYQVDTWSYSNGVAWLEYSTKLVKNQDTGDYRMHHSASFFTSSYQYYNRILNEMGARGWKKGGDLYNGSGMEGFNSYLYFGGETVHEMLLGVLVGKNSNYRGTTVYRIAII